MEVQQGQWLREEKRVGKKSDKLKINLHAVK